ncbi:NUDIX domain-containing protein [Haloferax sp. YSMS24]|uniref:NUDIX domain-containing protein n=1 Tax=unclassified Haloferax TaxID=2625095 RepID=UPI00398D3CF1
MTGPRTAARALVVDDGHLLTVQYGDGDDNWYLTPGGGQRQGESLSETVRREVYEETGYEVEVESLAFVRDLVPSNHFEDGDDADHRLDHFFWCDFRADSPASPADPPELDSKQVGVEWIPLETLPDIQFFPRSLVAPLRGRREHERRDAEYLGDVR